MLLKLKALAATGTRYLRHRAGSLLRAIGATLRALGNVVDNVGSAISPE